MSHPPRPFRYALDPVCVAAALVYAANRWLLKPHGIGGAFTHGYLNDVLCLPLFLPPILYAQRLLRLRRHDGPPRWWEILQHWVVFSIAFEVILPRFPEVYRTTADPLDAVAYLAGGVLAKAWWTFAGRPRLVTPGQSVRSSSGAPPRVRSRAEAFTRTGSPSRAA